MKAANWKKRSGRRHWPNNCLRRVRAWRFSGENLRRSASRRLSPDTSKPALARRSNECRRASAIHEIKFDGYRVQLQIANEDVKVFTRRGNDLLYRNGYDVRKLPLIERKTLLKKLIVKTAIQFSESFEVDGPEMFKHACGIGLEGVVSKVRDSRYNSGRGND